MGGEDVIVTLMLNVKIIMGDGRQSPRAQRRLAFGNLQSPSLCNRRNFDTDNLPWFPSQVSRFVPSIDLHDNLDENSEGSHVYFLNSFH